MATRRADQARQRFTGVAAGLLAAVSSTAGAVQIDYTVDAGIQQDDNVTLSPVDPIEQRFLRAGFGFGVRQDSSMFQLSLDGRAEYRNYRDDVFSDTLDGTMTGRLNWVAIPSRLHFTAEDSLTVQPVDALVPNAPGNRQQVNVLSVGPTMLFQWSQTVSGQADLRYIDSRAEVTEEFNSRRYELSLRGVKQLDPTSRVSLNSQFQDVDFDEEASPDYRRINLYARYARTLTRFDLGVDAGYSWIHYRTSTRQDPLLRLNLGWRPTQRSEFELVAINQFSDTATDALTGIPPNATVPEFVPVGDTVINASAFRTRRLALDYIYTGPRLQFQLGPYVETRRYIDADMYDEDVDGGRFDLSWLLQPRTTIGLLGNYDVHDYRVLDREDKVMRASAYAQREFSRNWSARLEWVRYERTSSLALQNVAQNTVYLSIIYSNR